MQLQFIFSGLVIYISAYSMPGIQYMVNISSLSHDAALPSFVDDCPELYSFSLRHEDRVLGGSNEDAFKTQNHTELAGFQRQNFSFKNSPIVVLFLVFDIITTINIFTKCVCVHMYIYTLMCAYMCMYAQTHTYTPVCLQ